MRRAFAGRATLVGALMCVLVGPALRGNQAVSFDTAAVERALGRPGQVVGDVYRIAVPRTDIALTIDGVTLRPGLALGGWIAFRETGGQAAVHGDLVLLESEVNDVISALQRGDIDITALHNHLLRESPSVMYLHFWSRGSALALARTLRSALEQTGAPPGGPPSDPDADVPDWAQRVRDALGRGGTVRGGVLSVSVPRPERISMMGTVLPPAMGMATAINVQDAGGGRVAATGDFVLLGTEVNAVARALRDGGVEITALHNHMIQGSPELYFMHFWVVGPPEDVARTLGAGVAATAAPPAGPVPYRPGGFPHGN